jgi:hypothetical protein
MQANDPAAFDVGAAVARAMDPAQQRQAALKRVSDSAAEIGQALRPFTEPHAAAAGSTAPRAGIGGQSEAVARFAAGLKMPGDSGPPAASKVSPLSPGTEALARSLKMPGDAAR